MNSRQVAQYERAMAIAKRDGLEVCGHGTRKSDGAAGLLRAQPHGAGYLAYNSSEPVSVDVRLHRRSAGPLLRASGSGAGAPRA